jgi:LPXTG-motif cell wall-anchored protein
LSSLLGAAAKYKQREIRIKTALLFGIISITMVAIIRWFVIPIVPHELSVINGVHIESSTISMILFSVLMIIAAGFMIRKKNKKKMKMYSHRRLVF